MAGIWQCSQVVILQGASRHTTGQGCVDVAEPEAEVKEVCGAPLRRDQFTQGLLETAGQEVEVTNSPCHLSYLSLLVSSSRRLNHPGNS